MKLIIYLLIATIGFSNVPLDALNEDVGNIKALSVYESLFVDEDIEIESEEIFFVKDNPYWDKIILKGNQKVDYQELRGENKLILELPAGYISDTNAPRGEFDKIYDFEIREVKNKQYLYLEFENEHPVRIFEDPLDDNTLHIAIGKSKEPYKFKVLLDAGHGGFDPGASHAGVHEKDIVLDMVLRMEHKLKDLGIDVEYTRDGDYFVVLHHRPRMSNELRPDAFISLHNNGNNNKSMSGNGVYIYTKNNRLVPEKIALAESIRQALKNEFPDWKDHGIIRKNLCVIRDSVDVSVLVEFGFLSNKKDREMLLDETIRDRGADAIAEGIYEYLNN